MITAPTKSQLRTMKLMAASVELHRRNAPKASCVLSINAVDMGVVRQTTADSLVDNGWATFNKKLKAYALTTLGLDHVDVKAFVRAFASSPESR